MVLCHTFARASRRKRVDAARLSGVSTRSSTLGALGAQLLVLRRDSGGEDPVDALVVAPPSVEHDRVGEVRVADDGEQGLRLVVVDVGVDAEQHLAQRWQGRGSVEREAPGPWRPMPRVARERRPRARRGRGRRRRRPKPPPRQGPRTRRPRWPRRPRASCAGRWRGRRAAGRRRPPAGRAWPPSGRSTRRSRGHYGRRGRLLRGWMPRSARRRRPDACSTPDRGSRRQSALSGVSWRSGWSGASTDADGPASRVRFSGTCRPAAAHELTRNRCWWCRCDWLTFRAAQGGRGDGDCLGRNISRTCRNDSFESSLSKHDFRRSDRRSAGTRRPG